MQIYDEAATAETPVTVCAMQIYENWKSAIVRLNRCRFCTRLRRQWRLEFSGCFAATAKQVHSRRCTIEKAGGSAWFSSARGPAGRCANADDIAVRVGAAANCHNTSHRRTPI